MSTGFNPWENTFWCESCRCLVLRNRTESHTVFNGEATLMVAQCGLCRSIYSWIMHTGG